MNRIKNIGPSFSFFHCSAIQRQIAVTSQTFVAQQYSKHYFNIHEIQFQIA